MSNWRHVVTQCLLLLFLGFIINRVFFYSPSAIETTASYALYPFLRTYECAISPFVAWCEHKNNVASLHASIKDLQANCDALQAESIQLQASALLYQDISEMIEFRKQYEVQDVILGHVLMKNFQAQEHYMLVNRGNRDQVHVNMVAVCKNCLIGRVVEVYPWYCKILLITDQWNKIAAITGTTKVKGIYEGRNSEKAFLNYVQHFAMPEVDELVFSTGEGLIYPQGFCLGKISEIVQGDIYHAVSIAPIIDFSTIEYVYIIQEQ
jgi:cell shape-determining protein MreC